MVKWALQKTYQVASKNTGKISKAPQRSAVTNFIGNIFGNQAGAKARLDAWSAGTAE